MIKVEHATLLQATSRSANHKTIKILNRAYDYSKEVEPGDDPAHPPISCVLSLDFSCPDNSQYIPIL